MCFLASIGQAQKKAAGEEPLVRIPSNTRALYPVHESSRGGQYPAFGKPRGSRVLETFAI